MLSPYSEVQNSECHVSKSQRHNIKMSGLCDVAMSRLRHVLVTTIQCTDDGIGTSRHRDVTMSRRQTSRCPDVLMSRHRDVAKSQRWNVATLRDVAASPRREIATSQRPNLVASRCRDIPTSQCKVATSRRLHITMT